MKNSKCIPKHSGWKEITEKANRNGIRASLYSVNGDVYRGEWKDSKKHGRGTMIWKQVNLIYEGDWKKGFRSGNGVLATIGQDGSRTKIYSGGWKNDKRHGYGENWYCDNEFYEGEWFANQRSGWGRQYYSDGSFYEGEWLVDKRNGEGTLRLTNENRYEGSWIDDKKNGKGKYIFQNTMQVMDGVWIDDINRGCEIRDLGARRFKTEKTYPIPEIALKDSDAIARNFTESLITDLRSKYC